MGHSTTGLRRERRFNGDPTRMTMADGARLALIVLEVPAM